MLWSYLKRFGQSLLTALIILAAVFTVSCKKNSDAASENNASVGVSGYSGRRRSVRVLPKWSHQAQFAGFYLADAKGFYTRRGIDVQILPGGHMVNATEALYSGIADFAQLHLLSVLEESASKPYLVNLAQISQKSSLMIVAHKSRGINQIQDLMFKRIGLWRGDYQTLPKFFINQESLNMQVVPIDSSVNLFLTGSVDAVNVMRYNEYHLLYQAGIEFEDLYQLSFDEIGLNIPEDGIYSTEAFYLANKELCMDFAEATMEGWLYAINHQDEALDVIMKIMRKYKLTANRPHQVWMLNEMREVILAKQGIFGTLEQDNFNEAIDLLKSSGINSKYDNYQRFVTDAHHR